MGRKFDEALATLDELADREYEIVPDNGKEYTPAHVNLAFCFGLAHAHNVMSGIPEDESLAGVIVALNTASAFANFCNGIEKSFEWLGKEASDAD